MQVQQYSVLFCLFLIAAVSGEDSAYPRVIVLSVGALSLDLIEDLNLESLSWYLKKSASAKYLVPVMPTKSLVNHMSIATGLYAQGHGVIDDCQYDEPAGQCVYGQPDLTKMPIWIANEKRGGISAVMNWPGAEEYNKHGKKPTYYEKNKYDLEQSRQAQINTRIGTIVDWLDNKNKPANLVMVYEGELDTVFHGHSDNPERRGLEPYYAEYFIKNLISEITCKTDVHLIVLGSHGGETVHLENGIHLNEILKGKYDCSFVAMGANAIVTPKNGQLEDVYINLGKHAKTTEGKIKYNVYYQEEIPENWNLKNLPLFQNKIFLVANMGYFFWNNHLERIKEKQLSERKQFVATIDGYWKDTEDDQSPIHTFFMARGPKFVTENQVPAFNTIDVYPLLRNLLELPENENEKLSDSVKELMWLTRSPVILEVILEPPVEKDIENNNIVKDPRKTGMVEKIKTAMQSVKKLLH